MCNPTSMRGRLLHLSLVLLIPAMGLGLRIARINAESFWVDEAFTVRASDHSLAEILKDNAKDVHPPLYYLGLFLWRLGCGHSDTAIRLYSTLWSMLGLVAIYLLAREFGGRQVGLIALILGAVNPLHAYFAQEARMYAQAAAATTFASWCLWRWIVAAARSPAPRGWWRWAVAYGVCAWLSIMTHYITVTVLVAQGLFALGWFRLRRRWAALVGYMMCSVTAALAFLPWLLYVLRVRETFYHPALGWMGYPPVTDYVSFLGLEFLQGRLAPHTGRPPVEEMILPVFLLGVCAWRAIGIPRGTEPDTGTLSRAGISYLFWLLAVPVALVAYLVYAYGPIYFRPSYPIFVLSPFLALAAIGCVSLRRVERWAMAVGLSLIMLSATGFQLERENKIDWRRFAEVYHEIGPPDHIVFFPDFTAGAAVHALDHPVPLVPRSQLETQLPQFEGSEIWVCWAHALSINIDHDYFEWLLSLGSVENVYVPAGPGVWSVTVGRYVPPSLTGRVDRWFEPCNIPGILFGLDDRGGFSVPEFHDTDQGAFRWSFEEARLVLRDRGEATTLVLNVNLPPPVPADYSPNLRFYIRRGGPIDGVFDVQPCKTVDKYRTGSFDVFLPVPPGDSAIRVGWRIRTVNLYRAGLSDDDRDLGLRVNWIGYLKKHDDTRVSTGSETIRQEQEAMVLAP